MALEATERLGASPKLTARDPRDGALIRKARRGSEQALEELFHRHWAGAYRAAYLVVGDRQGAEDIAQEAFISAVRNLDRFDWRRPFSPWLHRIAVNRAIDWARARTRRAEAPLTDAVDSVAGRRELSDELLAALVELTPEHRAVIVLRYLLGYRPAEIAAMLELPRGTVNSRLRRGLDALRPLLGEENG